MCRARWHGAAYGGSHGQPSRDVHLPLPPAAPDNPVDWQEWSQQAFAEAQRRDVPVLLSVGYAACHWCHVMAHESFEDEQVAQAVNRDFVAIKVDREERPDIDAVYMAATTALTGHGGWPMTCFLTPGGEPFYCGTYFPRDHFLQLLQAIHETWEQQRGQVLQTSGSIVARLKEIGARCPRRRSARRRLPAPCSGWRASSTRPGAGSAAHPSSRRRWCWSSCCATMAAPGRETPS